MTQLTMTVNGSAVSADVEPRLHLADFLRETLLLTGTHLGCEHGVCGACTVLLNHVPVRACITYAALCNGAAVCSIEGLDDDPVTIALRAAFTAEHALQCGYCTPGMMVTARDIILRLPDADDDRIRLELAGNLCRCTGYNGIVKAIRLVLDAGVAEPVPAQHAVPILAPIAASAAPSALPEAARTSPGLRQTLRIGLPETVVWTAIQDPSLVASCVPGARLTTMQGDQIEGEMLASLGPIQARFIGRATLVFDPLTQGGRIVGEGRDKSGGTRLSGEATFTVVPDGPDAALINLDITYALRGALAQFGRGPIVQVFAAEIAATMARNLEARLRGDNPPAPSNTLNGGKLFVRVLWQTLRGWLPFRTRRQR
jgi:carbon-monoxide dehydrogenase small subunit